MDLQTNQWPDPADCLKIFSAVVFKKPVVASAQVLQKAQDRLEHTKALLETTDQIQTSALTRQELLGDMFHAGGLGYYAQLTALSHIMG